MSRLMHTKSSNIGDKLLAALLVLYIILVITH